MIGDQTKETRTNADGVVEIGVQYLKTDEAGKSDAVMVWEPTMSKEAIDSVIAQATMKPEIQEEPIEEVIEEVLEKVVPEVE
jgi:hypothetical protein